MLLFIPLVFLLSKAFADSAIGIHLSSEVRLAAISKGNHKLESVFNIEGSRYVPSIISFNDRLPCFDSQSVMDYQRKDSISYTNPILFSLDPLHLGELKSKEGLVKESNGELGCKVAEGEFLPCEYVSFAYIKHLKKTAEEYLKVGAKDVVIAIPFDFTIHQKTFLAKFFEAAGLRVLSLMNENTAAALYHSLSYSEDGPTAHAIFNFSHQKVSCSIFTLSNEKDAAGNKTTSLKVNLNKTIDNWSGDAVDGVIARDFVKRHGVKFDNITKTDQRTILKEISKSMRGLNNYPKIFIKFGQLESCKGLSGEYSVEEISSILKSVLGDLINNIKKALEGVDLKIDSVFSIGALARFPLFLDALKEVFGKEKVQMTLDTDESISLGASFRCAQLHSAFRTKSVNIAELCQDDVFLTFDKPSQKQVQIFTKGTSQLGSVRILNVDKVPASDIFIKSTHETLAKLSIELPDAAKSIISDKKDIKIDLSFAFAIDHSGFTTLQASPQIKFIGSEAETSGNFGTVFDCGYKFVRLPEVGKNIEAVLLLESSIEKAREEQQQKEGYVDQLQRFKSSFDKKADFFKQSLDEKEFKELVAFTTLLESTLSGSFANLTCESLKPLSEKAASFDNTTKKRSKKFAELKDNAEKSLESINHLSQHIENLRSGKLIHMSENIQLLIIDSESIIKALNEELKVNASKLGSHSIHFSDSLQSEISTYFEELSRNLLELRSKIDAKVSEELAETKAAQILGQPIEKVDL